MRKKTAEEIRNEICRLLQEDYSEGKLTREIRAGDVDDVNLPNVCQAMTGQKIRTHCSDFLVEVTSVRDNQGRTGPTARPSTNFWVTYKIVADSSSKRSEERNAPYKNGRWRKNENIESETRVQDGPSTLEERLKALKYMKDEGIITEDDFNTKIREILDRL